MKRTTMPSFVRDFSVFFETSTSGIAIVNSMGPLVESWNKKHDRQAALHVNAIRCDGVALDRDNAFRSGRQWELNMHMTGPSATDEAVANVSQRILDTLLMPMG